MTVNLEVVSHAADMAFIAAFVLAEAVLVGMATGAVVTAWFKDNGPFTLYRAYAEAMGGWLGALLGCPVCLSYHIAALLVMFLVLPAVIWPAALPWLHLPILWLAAAGITNRERTR